MAVDLSYSAQVIEITTRTGAFIDDVVLPVEDRHSGDIAAAGGDDLRRELQSAAKGVGRSTGVLALG